MLIMKYVIKGIINRKKVLVFSLIILFMFLYPLYTYEKICNNNYFIVYSRKGLISDEDSRKLEDIPGVNGVVAFLSNFSRINNWSAVIIKTDKRALTFILRKRLIKGRLPRGGSELLVAENYYLDVGANITLGDSEYLIVGMVSREAVERILVFGSEDVDIVLIQVINYLEYCNELIVWVDPFASVTRMREAINSTIHTDITIIPAINWRRKTLIPDALFTIVLSTVLPYLFLYSSRKENAVLFMLGWTFAPILEVVVLRYIIVFIIGYILSLVSLYGIIELLLRNHLFFTSFLFIPLVALLMNIIGIYFFLRIFSKKFVEGLVE